jgi:site-specific recombinase XerD
MSIYKRRGTWWTDFAVSGRRYRVSLKTSDRRKALGLEKLRIAEAQNHGGFLPRKTVGLTVDAAAQVYLTRREPFIAPRTVELEKGAIKNLSKHLGRRTLGSLNNDSLSDYVGQRKNEGVGNRTINIEVGVLRRILKQYRVWQFVSDGYKQLSEPHDIGRALTPEQELNLFTTASSRPEWSVAFWVSLISANTTAGGCEIRNLRLGDADLGTRMMFVRVGKNKFRVRAIPLNQTATWAVAQLLSRAHALGAQSPDHYLIPRRVQGKQYDVTKPPSRWAWRTAWRKLTEACGMGGLRSHDLRHHAVTKLAESADASEQTVMAIAGHVSRQMLEHYSHIRQEAKRRATDALDNVTITAHLSEWKHEADEREHRQLVERKGRKTLGTAEPKLLAPAPKAGALPGCATPRLAKI